MSKYPYTAELVRALTVREIQRAMPKTQEECCAIAARVSMKVAGEPQSDRAMLDAAVALAKGLFGPAYDRAEEGTRWLWIDMCERALRENLSR